MNTNILFPYVSQSQKRQTLYLKLQGFTSGGRHSGIQTPSQIPLCRKNIFKGMSRSSWDNLLKKKEKGKDISEKT